MNLRTLGLVSLPVSALLVAAAVTIGGPLVPPAGPVAPTYKTLTEVEPRILISAATTPGDADSVYRITASGSYYLTSNLIGVAAKSGIEIAAPNVTLDLMGFELIGIAGSLDGVTTGGGSYAGVTVRGGAARVWGQDGFDLLGTTSCRLENLTAQFNGATGIRTGTSATLASCMAANNNLGGIQTARHTTLLNCAARNNTGVGIHAERDSTVTACTASENSGAGFRLELGCTARGCAAAENGLGFLAFSSGNLFEQCTASENSGDGFSALSGNNTIRNCVAYLNTGDGIEVGASCLVVGNECSGNGPGAFVGSGIHATGADNRIENNTALGNDVGIDVDVAGSFIVRNTAANNTTNFGTTGTQTIGPIITATGTIASTNPWANFEY